MTTSADRNEKPHAAGVKNGAGKLAGATGEEEIGAAGHAQGHMPAASRASVGRRGANGLATAGRLFGVPANGCGYGLAQSVGNNAALLGDADRLRSEPVAHGPRQVGGGAKRLDALIDDGFHVGTHLNGLCSGLSTIIFDAESTGRADNPRMNRTPDLSTFTGRLEYVRTACKCPSERAFAEWLGLRSQAVLTNWKARGSAGKGGPALHRVTGVNTDWLRDGTGVAFPEGSKVYDGPAIADPDRLEAIETAIMGIVAAMAVARPTVAEAMVNGWQRDREIPERMKSSGLLPLLSGHVRKTIAGAARKGSHGKGSLG